jgi:hypothetical protein
MTTTTATAGEIQLLDPHTGVVAPVVDARHLLAVAGLVDPACEDIEAALKDAPMADLVCFATRAALLASVVREADNAVRYELPLRLDKGGCWTNRDHGALVESPSPEAGTRAYDSALLHEALARLVDDGIIEPEAAAKALEVVPAPASVSYDDLRLILAGLDGELDQPGYLELRESVAALIAFEPEPRLQQRPGGIKALLKLKAARPAIEACEVQLTPPRRRATVKPLGKVSK